MIKKIYLYEQMPNNLEENGMPINDWRDLPEITRIINSTFSFYGNYQHEGVNAKLIKRKMFIKAFTENGTYQYFRIKTAKKNLSGITIIATHIGYEANRNFIQSAYIDNGNGKQIMDKLKESLAFDQKFSYESDVTTYHQFSAKQVNPIEAIIGGNNGNQNLAGVCDAELDIDNYTLILRERIGDDNGFRIDFGKNLASIEETIDDSSVVNRLYLIGGVPEDTNYDADQEPITYAYLSVSGVTEENVQIGKRENGDCKTVEDLKKWGQSLFDKDRIHEPKVTHEVDMVMLENTIEYRGLYENMMSLRFGDTAYISLKSLDIEAEERMIEYVWYPTICKYKSIVLGNDLGMYTSSIETQVTNVRKNLETKSDELINAVINATNWITGSKGGYVRMRPKNAPSEILIMDKPDVADAKKVWRWNLGGLGYSSTGVNGPYGTAITQNGVIVADFIKAGTLEGVKMRAVDNDFAIQLFNGILKFTKKSGSSEAEMVAFAPTYTDAGLQGINLIQNPNYSFAISSKGANGAFLNVLEVPKDSTAENRKLKLYGDVSVDGKLFLNGKEITPGGGGGGDDGWNGVYPDIVKTQAEKFAWQAWATLRSLGYSEGASAGILGNINGEAGPSMNPDIDQIGGPAYGAVQFDGSAYPLVGTPTNDGREYFQRLVKASGVTGDYKEMPTQMKVVNWSMTAGQWIGAVEPTSVDGFKSMSNPQTAATVFERNFERPASTHPERSGYAQTWYNLFAGVPIPKADWRNPIRVPYIITQEWDQIGYGTGQIHGGIDVAPTGGATPPIYAARIGKVVQIVPNHEVGGNYVVIEHDGYWTYYGHLANIQVAMGQQVTTDTVVGICGATGLATGVHLHFEVWKGKQWDRINPRDVINF
ncbi:peptidoglycan DD-metalloendopeptidase family protein [Lactococcus raffinolactis]|uniref:Peptidoglycan DD-metalloendopeptidase family protein n=1 Tax=Pseudolactococcus raffinolactis TaxID=1366 RepID=A0AAE7CS84_9LACT|nr:phage tail tip lysozyme [Lactococcus raffinolactis]QIW58339.1 peptidoglycan DD-metalloendopeptidase family protein [Lactococcus raffinolactis]